MLGDGVTDSVQLDDIGGALFDGRWMGAHSSEYAKSFLNHAPRDARAIVNTDPSHKPGEHWVALAKDAQGRAYIYDSFGRRPGEMSKQWTGGAFDALVDAEDDAEQDLAEKNCGQRCIAFLVACDRYGAAEASAVL